MFQVDFKWTTEQYEEKIGFLFQFAIMFASWDIFNMFLAQKSTKTVRLEISLSIFALFGSL